MSFGKIRLQSIVNLGPYVVTFATGCGVLFATFSFFSTLSHNVDDLKSGLAEFKSDSKQSLARMDARMDDFNARFDRVYYSTVTLSLGIPAVLMIISALILHEAKDKKHIPRTP
jgi:hypothetical protein